MQQMRFVSQQDIYRHAFTFLGKLLHLTHEFPQPKEVYRGAVFTAFYMVMMHEGVCQYSL